MGSWFSNLHIKKRDGLDIDAVIEGVRERFVHLGYKAADADSAECVAAVCTRSDSGWYTLCSEEISFESDADAGAQARDYTGLLNTPVMAVGCMDSDFLFMNLMDFANSIDAWTHVGSAGEMGFHRRKGLNAWKNYVTDFNAFKAAFKKEYTFAEDVLYETAGALELPGEQGTLQCDILDMPEHGCEVHMLHFMYPVQREGATPPRLERYTFPTIMLPEKTEVISFINKGGPVKGLEVRIEGPFVEHDEITFDVELGQIKYGDYGYTESRKLEMKKVQFTDDTWAYSCKLPAVCYPGAPANAKYNRKEEARRSFFLRITPHGIRRKALDIKVFAIPINCFEGYTGWCACMGSKIEFINSYNEQQLEFYEMALRSYEQFPRDKFPDADIHEPEPPELLDINDFDI